MDMTESKWLKSVCEAENMSDKDIVRYGRWYVNADGDLFANKYADIGKFEGAPYCIFDSDLKEGNFEFEASFRSWYEHLLSKGWFLLDDQSIIDFARAFCIAWHRSCYCNNKTAYQGEEWPYAPVLRIGEVCFAEAVDISPKALDNQDRLVVLEYNEQKCHFHFNKKYINDPEDIYQPIAQVSSRVASMFTAMMQARLINGARYSLNQVRAEWNYFLFNYYLFLDNAHAFGLPDKAEKEVMDEVMKRVNFYDGDYLDNEMMKLRTIGVPQIEKKS